MRSTEEILAKARQPNPEDPFGFGQSLLVYYLNYQDAKEFLKETVTEAEWKPDELSREAVLKEMRGYMEFAWGKATGHRGLSARRSVSKFNVWIWVLGDSPIEAEYSQYGCPILAAICARYDFPVPQDKEAQRMIQGLMCFNGCEQGCGA